VPYFGTESPLSIELNIIDIDELLKQTTLQDTYEPSGLPKSAIAKHYINTNHIFTKCDFSILLNERHRYHLRITKSLLIKAGNPKSNGTERSMPLRSFSARLPTLFSA
jgi:hypothetical protein